MLTNLKLEVGCSFILTSKQYSLPPAPHFEFQGRSTIKLHSGNAVVVNVGMIKGKYLFFETYVWY